MHPHQTTRTTSAGSLLSTVCGANPSRLSGETHLTIDGSHNTVYQLDSAGTVQDSNQSRSISAWRIWPHLATFLEPLCEWTSIKMSKIYKEQMDVYEIAFRTIETAFTFYQSPPNQHRQCQRRLVHSGSLLVKPLLSQSHSSLPVHTPADLLFGPHE